MTKYKLQLVPFTMDGSPRTPCAVLKDDTWSIPFAQDNMLYQEYLKWLAAGNTPEPADEQN
jgi:hypothetical protein